MFTEFVVKALINVAFERFGKMLKLEIDSQAKTILLDLLPAGETTPIQVRIGHYEVLSGPPAGIRLSQIETSREWLSVLIREFYPEPVLTGGPVQLWKLLL
ncbi:MAG: hypothetical protein WC326_00225 [Candidatus Delongbacteria bacterium]